MSAPDFQILLVEDNPGDADLMRERLEESSISTRLHVAVDGVQALDFLRRQDEFRHAPRPDLILLDLNLPKKDGKAVLADVKRDPELRRIPVIVLTTSAAEADITESYDLGANCYISKPMDLAQFEAVVHALESFWFSVVKLPPR